MGPGKQSEVFPEEVGPTWGRHGAGEAVGGLS